MKKFLMVLALLACAGLAYAGPNAGGSLVVHNTGWQADIVDGCTDGTIPTDCGTLVTRLDGAQGVPSLWRVYAMFRPGSSPRLLALTWGVTYPANIALLTWRYCTDWEFYDPNAPIVWPGSGSGNSTGWNMGNAQTGLVIPIYYFDGYTYGGTGQFCVGPNPDPGLGGNFGDDSSPIQLDPIAGYGCLGFDMDGVGCAPTAACCIGADCAELTEVECATAGGVWHPGVTCSPTLCNPPILGACCVGETCTMTTQADCQGNWLGENYTCEPVNPCLPPVPTEKSTWGHIKNNYR